MLKRARQNEHVEYHGNTCKIEQHTRLTVEFELVILFVSWLSVRCYGPEGLAFNGVSESVISRQPQTIAGRDSLQIV